jgi:hypothetical protein
MHALDTHPHAARLVHPLNAHTTNTGRRMHHAVSRLHMQDVSGTINAHVGHVEHD